MSSTVALRRSAASAVASSASRVSGAHRLPRWRILTLPDDLPDIGERAVESRSLLESAPAPKCAISAELEFIAFWLRFLAGISAVALVLSLAGIYAVMSFTVASRTREIGIRMALGASQRRVIRAIFVRPLRQVALGVFSGIALMVSLASSAAQELPPPRMALGFLLYAVCMFAVCILACIVPTRRALRVEPTEALRSDG